MSPRRFRPPALYTKAPFLRSVLDGMPESVKIIDPQYRVVFVNEMSRKNLDMDLNEVRGKACYQSFYGFKERCVFCNMTKVFERGEELVSYTTFAQKGVTRNFQVSVFPLFGANQKVEYAVEVVKDVTQISKGAPLPQSAGKISSRDKAFGLVFDQMAQWSDEDHPVLLQGEKGTGKKSFAKALHQRSPRANGPFRIFHCVAGSSGDSSDSLFGAGGAWEKTQGGTLYLDDICRLGETGQKTLASKLAGSGDKDRPRVIGATTLDVYGMVQQEIFRLDLYNRFASHLLRLPSLRERRQDLPFLAHHFIETFKVLTGSPAEKLGKEALCQLMTYGWPGNIRELESQIERACLLATGPEIEKLDIAITPPQTARLGDLMNITEQAYLVDALTKTKGCLKDASELAGLSLKTLQRKMRRYGLKPKDFRNISPSES